MNATQAGNFIHFRAANGHTRLISCRCCLQWSLCRALVKRVGHGIGRLNFVGTRCQMSTVRQVLYCILFKNIIGYLIEHWNDETFEEHVDSCMQLRKLAYAKEINSATELSVYELRA
jgi:hypothetical protein